MVLFLILIRICFSLGLIVLTLCRKNTLVTHKIGLFWLDDVKRGRKLFPFGHHRTIFIFLDVFFLKVLDL